MPERRRSALICALVTLVYVVVGLSGPGARAANGAPANDDFVAAQTITGMSATINATNVGASKQAGEPSPAGSFGGHSIWYSWTSPLSTPFMTNVTIDTCGADFDSLLGMYTGVSVDVLTEVASNDDTSGCGTTNKGSRVTFFPTAGTTYFIAVDGKSQTTGSIVLKLLQPPPNDFFAAPNGISNTLPSHASGTNVGATKESGEPNHAGNAGGHSVWWFWQAASSGSVTINTCASDFDTLLGVYTGSTVTSLSTTASNDQGLCGVGGSKVMFTATANTQYRIAVDGFNGATGNVSLDIAVTPPTTPLANDNFANATVLTGSSGGVSGNNSAASKETGEPNHGGNPGGKSVWYSWTAPVSGSTQLNLFNCQFTPLIGVYTGTAVNALTTITGTGGCVGLQFVATAGTTYRIAIDGQNGASGAFSFNYFGQLPPPANDNFANATAISASTVNVVVTNVNATKEAGEPNHAGNAGGHSIWWSWTAPSSGNFTISLCDSAFNTLLGVYTGSDVGSLALVASNDDGCGSSFASSVAFAGTSGTVYRIAVDGFSGQTGTVNMAIGAQPPNDSFASAEVLTGSAPHATGTTVGATKEPGEPNHVRYDGSQFSGYASVWYSWTAPVSGPINIDTCASSFDETLLSVYTGSSVGSLTTVPGTRSRCGNRTAFKFIATLGTTYEIAVDSAFSRGVVDLHLNVPPTNDDFAAASPLGAAPAHVVSTNGGASLQSSEPVHGGASGGASVWYSWTAPVSSAVTVETCSSNFNTTLGVYTGSAVNALTTVAGNNDACGTGGTRSRVVFNATSGTAYSIAVDGVSGASGSIVLDLIQAAANDGFANAQVLTGFSPTAHSATTSVGATKESGEPNHAGDSGGRSLWYSWTSGATQTVVIDTCDGSFDTLLGVYTGSSVSALTQIANDDDGCVDAGGGSRLAFAATNGTTYKIAVDGWGGANGAVDLDINPGLANDAFAGRFTLTGAAPHATGSNVGTTKEASEPLHAANAGGRSVWYEWTAPANGSFAIDLCDSNFDTLLGVYTGAAVNNLVEVASNDDACGKNGSRSRVLFGAFSGTTYLIGIDGKNRGPAATDAVTGSIDLDIGQPVINDDFANAQALSGPLTQATGDNRMATVQTDEPSHAGVSGRHSLWYSWSTAWPATVTLDTCASGFDTVLAVYTGSSVGALVPVASNDDGCASGRGSRVSFGAVAGVTYEIAADGHGGGTGALALALAKQSSTPTLGNTDPASPSFVNNPRVGGVSEPDTTISLFTTADCSGAAAASGLAADLAGAGIEIALPSDQVSSVRATAIGAAGIVSGCSSPILYTEDSTAPIVPVITGFTPSSPANNNAPVFSGIAEAGSIVKLFVTPDCSGPAVAQGAASDFLTAGFAVPVSNDTTTNVRATATDAAGNVSACSGALTYIEDSTAPIAPTLTLTDPTSPSPDNRPKVKGAAEPGSTVRLYTTPDCSGDASATGNATGLAGAGIEIVVPSDQTTDVRATATDAAGNTSVCSSPRAYVEDSTAQIQITDGPSGETSDRTPTFSFTSEPGAAIECSIAPVAAAFGQCSGPGLSHTRSTPLAFGDYTFRVRATDLAGNIAVVVRSFTVVVTVSPVLTGTDPASPSSVNGPRVKGTAPDGSTVRLYASPDCSEPVLATGSASDLAGGGIQVDVASDLTTRIRATATDPESNVSDCSLPLAYTEDSTSPGVAIDSGPLASSTSGPGVTFAFSSPAGDVSRFECSLDGTDFATCTSTKAYQDLSGASHTFQVRAVDNAGNIGGAAGRTWTVDVAGPVVTIDSGPGASATTGPNVSFTIGTTDGDLDHLDCKLDAGGFGACTSPKSYLDLLGGSHTFVVRGFDLYGNAGTPLSRTWTVDATGPTVTIDSGPAPSTISGPGVSFGFSSTADDLDRFDCRLDAGGFAPCDSPKSYQALSDGSHTVRVRGVDDLGNTGTAITRTWTVDAVAPTTTITSGPKPKTTDRTPTFTFTSSEDGRFECKIDATALYANCSSPFTPKKLKYAKHTFFVRAIDAAENVGVAVTRAFTVQAKK